MDLARPVGGICSNCGQVRPLEELLAYWPAIQPDRERYVCRPSMPAGGYAGCFREVVGTVDEHVIAPAVATAQGAA